MTEKVAKTIAGQLDCDIVRIVSNKKFTGLFGFIIAGYSAMKKINTPIEKLEIDPLLYDFIIIETPVWAATMAIPVVTFLTMYGNNLKKMAFFLTKSSQKNTKAFSDMEEVCGKRPEVTVELRTKQVKNARVFTEEALEEISRFTNSLKKQYRL